MGEITRLLRSVATGDASARDALFAVAYPGLEKLARARLRDGGRNTLLDTRGLVHESYLRYVRGGALRAEDRRAFFAFASQVMRSVIVSSVRERAAEKRGNGRRPLRSRRSGRNICRPVGTRLRVHDVESTEINGVARCAERTSAVTASGRSPRRWRSPNARCSGYG